MNDDIDLALTKLFSAERVAVEQEFRDDQAFVHATMVRVRRAQRARLVFYVAACLIAALLGALITPHVIDFTVAVASVMACGPRPVLSEGVALAVTSVGGVLVTLFLLRRIRTR